MRVYIVYDCVNNSSKVFNDLFGAQQHAGSLIDSNCSDLELNQNELVWYNKYLGEVYVYIECKELGQPHIYDSQDD